MLSYLDTIKSVVDTGLYTRGLKIYLSGEVLQKKDLSLDFWREYQIKGKNDNYTVKTPLVHLALNSQKFAQASEVVKQVVSCTCPYFLEYGQVCKHIVAVYADLEKEFKIKDPQEKTLQESSIIDNIFEADEEKKVRILLNNFEYCVEKDFSQTQISQYLGDGLADYTQHFLAELTKKIPVYVGDYTSEKKISKIASNSFLIRRGGKVWLNFWVKWINQFDEVNQILFWVRLWQNYLADKIVDDKFLDEFLPSLPSNIKNQILAELKEEYKDSSNFWINFIFKSQMVEWLEENFQNLDVYNLVKACKMLPDRREDFEFLIAENMRVWSDFLLVGDYQEVFKFFSYWQENIGRSEIFEEVLEYFKDSHKRKPKLLSELEKL